MKLGSPARYFPLKSDQFRLSPGLHGFGTDFGNATADQQLFQLDDQFPDYRAAKEASRSESLSKYFQLGAIRPETVNFLVRLVVDKLVTEHPQWFALRNESDAGFRLDCKLTGESLAFGADYQYQPGLSQSLFGYQHALDALAMQIQEDLAVVELAASGQETVSAIHLCFPNHWAAADKLGKGFLAVHAPIPEFAGVADKHQALVQAMVYRGPFVRFAWGLSTDRRLNHHPVPPANLPESEQKNWPGRRFDPDQPELYLRVERQVIWGLPEVQAALFTIRTYFTDVTTLPARDCKKIAQMLETMSDPVQHYKGVGADRGRIVAWLSSLSH